MVNAQRRVIRIMLTAVVKDDGWQIGVAPLDRKFASNAMMCLAYCNGEGELLVEQGMFVEEEKNVQVVKVAMQCNIYNQKKKN